MADGIMKKYPQDIVINMILRLPVKFLLRFKSVSRSFYTLIQSSIFINLYLNHTKISTNDNILLKRSFKEDIERYKAIVSFLSMDHDNHLKSIYPDLDVPYISRSYTISNDKLSGPVHGLVALMNPIDSILFNPSTRKYRLMPSSPFDAPKGYYRSIENCGFGFDSIVNDFKIFRICRVYKEDKYGYAEDGEKTVEVYELGIDIWRELDHVALQLPCLFWLTSSMFYKGTYHWITTSDDFKQIILCFDMSTEIFCIMKTPDTCKFLDGTQHNLLLLADSLSFICYPCLESMIDQTKDLTKIWVMKDYNVYDSWIKKYTIRGLPTESPLAVWEDYLLLYQSESGYLMSYDLNTTEINEYTFRGCLASMRLTTYKESLTPLPRTSQSSTKVENY